MANRNLNAVELDLANFFLSDIRMRLRTLAGDDDELLFAYRRKIFKELTYDERGKPTHRRMLKARKMGEQAGLCFVCSDKLPEKNAILDRVSAMLGYTSDNTRLICTTCDTKIQTDRGYA